MDQDVRSRVMEAFYAWWATQETDGDFLIESQRRERR
jgi:hypothetical protein